MIPKVTKRDGGDLVDYVELDGFRHGIVLGDVAGKGLGAALLTAKLQATLRAVRNGWPQSRIWAVLEPRSWSLRRNVFHERLASSFLAADEVVIAAVFAADAIWALVNRVVTALLEGPQR